MDDVDIELEETRQELAQLRAQGALESQLQILEKHEAYEDIKETERRLKATMEELHNKSSLHVYAQCIKTARNIDVASSYTISLEAQVCRSVHHVVVLKKQLALVKKACDSVVDLLQGAISNFVEENNLAEMTRINDMTYLDDEKAFMKEQYTLELEEQKEALAMLEKKDVSLVHKDSKFINVSSNVMAVVKDSKIVSYVVRQHNKKNGWVPLSMPKGTRSSSVHKFNRVNSFNRAHPTAMT